MKTVDWGEIVDGAIVIIAALTLMLVGFTVGVVYGKLTAECHESPGKIVIEHRYPEGDK